MGYSPRLKAGIRQRLGGEELGQKEGGYTICRADCVAPFGIVREEPRGSCPRLVEGFDDRKELLYAKGSTTD